MSINSDTHKDLYQLLQCIHHLEKTNKSHQIPKAFTKKQKELKGFIKPAQITDSFIKNYGTVVKKYIVDCINTLNNHYEERISELLGYLRSQKVQREEIEIASRIALRWGRRNFGKKLSEGTINKFHVITNSIPLPSPASHHAASQSSSSPNTANSPGSSNIHTQQSPKPQTSNPSTSTNTSMTHKSTSLSQKAIPTKQPPPDTGNDRDVLPDPETSRPLYSSVVNTPRSTPHTQQTSPTTPRETRNHNSPRSTQSSPQTPPRTPRTDHLSVINSNNKVDVQGYTDPLSNFFPFPFIYKQRNFISAEHAYQHEKSEFYGAFAFGERIRQAPTAGEAKKIGKEMDRRYHQLQQQWDWEARQIYIMEEILSLKAEQCPQFRQSLLNTGDKIITHNVIDQFWGSSHKTMNGKIFEGHGGMARVLVKLRNKWRIEAQPKNTTKPTHRSSTPSTPPTSKIPRSITTANRFSPLENETPSSPDIPLSPDISSSPDSSPSNPPSKRRRVDRPHDPQTTSKASGPTITTHDLRARWRIPPLKAHTVVLGDSNIKNITNLETEVRSIEFHAFPGAKLTHFENLMSPTLHPQITPKVVVLSIGMNNRSNRPAIIEHQLRNMLHNASKYFPNATIHIPLINIPPEIPDYQQTNLKQLNQLTNTLSKQLHTFKIIPILPQENFKINPKDTRHKIHWSTETANSIITHWTSYLN